MHQWYQSRRSSSARYGGEIEELDEEYEMRELEGEVAELKSNLQNLVTEFRRILESEKFGFPSGSSGVHHFDRSQSIERKKNMEKSEVVEEIEMSAKIEKKSDETIKLFSELDLTDSNSFILLKKEKGEKRKASGSDGNDSEDEEVIEKTPTNSLTDLKEFKLGETEATHLYSKLFQNLVNEKYQLSDRSLSKVVVIDELPHRSDYREFQCYVSMGKHEAAQAFDEMSNIKLVEKGMQWHLSNVFDEMPQTILVEKNSEWHFSNRVDEMTDSQLGQKGSWQLRNSCPRRLFIGSENIHRKGLLDAWDLSFEEAECQRAYELGNQIYMSNSTFELLKEPVVEVSICSLRHQGMSFILNQMLGGSNGFQVTSTRPCTEYNLFFLDSEEIDAYDLLGTCSTHIFPWNVILSNMFIFKPMGGIEEVALDRVSCAIMMSDEGMKASTNEGMKWHLSVTKQGYMPLPPPEPPPWLPSV